MAKTCWNVFVSVFGSLFVSAGKNSVFWADSPVLLNMAHLSAVMYEHVPVFEYSGCVWLMRIFVWWSSTQEEAVHQDSFHPPQGTGRALGGGDALYLICYRGWWHENCSLNVICTNQHLMVFKRIWLMKTSIKVINQYWGLNVSCAVLHTVWIQPKYINYELWIMNYADSHV